MIKDILEKLREAGRQAISYKNSKASAPDPDYDYEYEYCPNCYANLALQKGYRNDFPYWICKGCGELLINPEVDAKNNIAWICDNCGSMLNVQDGFHELCEEWKCSVCGFTNKIDKSKLYVSEDEYQASLRDPYKGLSNEDALSLSLYQDIRFLSDRRDIILVKHRESGALFIKKFLTAYNKSIYEYLMDRPVSHMPEVRALYEGSNCLILIEEYIEGRTVEELLDDGPLSEGESIRIAKGVCRVLKELHSLPVPIIHRDVKPSNVMITREGDVFLLDMNVAKWYDPEKTDDTRYLGTQYYAAPEQAGYGFSASSAKSDIYAAGILLNVMLTGKFPKEQKAEGRLWGIIERCISLEAKDRFTAEELLEKLNEFGSE